MILPAGVFTLELFPEKTRFVCEIMGSLFWTTGLVIISGIAYLLQDYSWRYLQILLSCIELFFAFELDSILASMNYKIFKDFDQFVSLYFGK